MLKQELLLEKFEGESEVEIQAIDYIFNHSLKSKVSVGTKMMVESFLDKRTLVYIDKDEEGNEEYNFIDLMPIQYEMALAGKVNTFLDFKEITETHTFLLSEFEGEEKKDDLLRTITNALVISTLTGNRHVNFIQSTNEDGIHCITVNYRTVFYEIDKDLYYKMMGWAA